MLAKKTILTLAFLLAASVVSTGAASGYRSDLLERMSGVLHADSLYAGLGEGFHYAAFRHGGFPVSVRIGRDEIQHLGFSLFPASTRSQLPEAICDFLERYALELFLPLPREKSIKMQMLEDGVEFAHASLDRMVSALCRDTVIAVSLQNIRERRYCFSWKNALDSGTIVFPVDWQLLSGRSMTENENRLPGEVEESIILQPLSLPEPHSLVQTAEGLLSTDEGCYYIANLSANRYYQKKRGGVCLFDDPRQTDAFTANLFTGAGINNSLILKIKMRTYGLTSLFFTTSLDKWISFCIGNGCKPYWGIISEDSDKLEGELIFRNAECGYNHVMRIWIPRQNLYERTGEIQARLMPFVPTHGIRYLFEETYQ